ncbi:MAG TPA: hypothetical protein VF188_13720 [Longimicrobiales bacterium]
MTSLQSVECRAHFHRFGDFALEFEVVHSVLDPDHDLYMNIRQAIDLALIRRFEALGIAVALPAQTVVLQGSGAPAVPAGGGA